MTWDRLAARAARDAERTAERETASVLAGWLETEGIAKGDEAAHVAETLAEDAVMRHLTCRLSVTGRAPKVLRDAAEALASTVSMSPAELAMENYRHGHGQFPGLIRIGEVVND